MSENQYDRKMKIEMKKFPGGVFSKIKGEWQYGDDNKEKNHTIYIPEKRDAS
ncbi:MAG: hypothetical protein Tsb0015_13470 [Simkaniaceae bacterium]